MRFEKLSLVIFFLVSRALAAGADFDITLPEPPDADQVIWVAPDGDDSAAGTESAPLATPAAAARA
ncbi:MAG: hypothetical protein J6S40_06260, partial [Thermoguttaceae bacterium]|nr:hypothetical protein [Thermoguttaceae bacterium]